MRGVLRAVSFAAVVAAAAVPATAWADVQHVVARGHTIEAIANRYRVTTKAILDANHIADAKRIKPGDVLVIPTKDVPGSGKGTGKKGPRDGSVASLSKTKGRETTTYAMKPKTPDVLHIKRLATNEEFDIRVNRGRIAATTLKTFSKMMRSPNGMMHPVEPRLVALLRVVSNHFGSRKIEVISGYRPFTPTQYNPHSNHMHGKAIDFRVVGVPNEVVRDFCRTLKNTGCGYYPNSVFVHMDARDKSTYWIDYSRPGERPNYKGPNESPDEDTTDVHDERHPATGETPGDGSDRLPEARTDEGSKGAADDGHATDAAKGLRAPAPATTAPGRATPNAPSTASTGAPGTSPGASGGASGAAENRANPDR